MTKRTNGAGSVYQRSDGRWVAIPPGTDPATGKRYAPYYGRTQKEVRGKLREALKRLEDGAPVRDATATVSAWLDEWVAGPLEASSRGARTKQLYADTVRIHLKPEAIGAVTLDRLKPSHLDALIMSKRAAGLADSSVQRIYLVLKVALDDAVRDGHLARNPAARVAKPRRKHKEARCISPQEVTRLLNAAEGRAHYPVLALIAATGLRRGEALALRWEDVDLEAATLKVRGTISRVDGKLVRTDNTKTAAGKRTLPLTPGMVALLKVVKRQQNLARMKARNIWTERGYVFTTATGQAMEPRGVLRTLKEAAKTAGIEPENVCIHTLRHTAATAWLEAGVNIKAVSALMGHASIRVTADTYGHVSDRVSREAMDTLAKAIGL